MELSSNEFGIYLKQLRESQNLTTRDVYALSGVSNSYLSLIENGHRRASAIVLKKLAPIYKVNYLDLYNKSGFADSMEVNSGEAEKTEKNVVKNKLPIFGISNNEENYMFSLLNIEVLGYYNTDEYNSDEYFALKIFGNTMFPFCEGDLVIVKKQDYFESGDTCVILINKKAPIIKDVIKTDKGLMLISKIPNYTPIEYTYNDIDELPIQILGIIVEAKIKGIFSKKGSN